MRNVESRLQADRSVVAVPVKCDQLALREGQLPGGLVGQPGVQVHLVDLQACQRDQGGCEGVHAWKSPIVGKVEEYGTNWKGWPVPDEDRRKDMFVVYFEQLDEGVEGVMKTRKSSSNDSELRSSHRQAILLTAKCTTDAHLKMSRSCLAGAADTQVVPGCVQTLPVAAERVDYMMDGEVSGQVA